MKTVTVAPASSVRRHIRMAVAGSIADVYKLWRLSIGSTREAANNTSSGRRWFVVSPPPNVVSESVDVVTFGG